VNKGVDTLFRILPFKYVTPSRSSLNRKPFTVYGEALPWDISTTLATTPMEAYAVESRMESLSTVRAPKNGKGAFDLTVDDLREQPLWIRTLATKTIDTQAHRRWSVPSMVGRSSY